MSQRATIQDIARYSGVSTATVDRVINGRGGVRLDKERVVLEAARELGDGRRLVALHARLARIAVVTQPPGNPFHAALQEAFRTIMPAYREQNIACFEHHAAISQPERAASLIRALARDYDGLILCLPDHPSIRQAVTDTGRKLPIITIASDITASERLAYIGSDNHRAGRIAADMMGRLLGPRSGRVALIAGTMHYIGHQQRYAGFMEALDERYAALSATPALECLENDDRAADAVHALLHEHRDIVGIYHFSTGADAIASLLEKLGMADKLIFITHELTPHRASLLRSGMIDLILDQNPMLEARTALSTLSHHLGRSPAPLDGPLIPLSVHTRETV
ncbi:LacI family DNA-binding transcriptional regulator [Asaia krungthepensis]|uniref:LacI family transcription regulator n=1 Tax=Asaia krungthepensis NRIC 0535 TaxID=1307925 RepID=A0ABQ0Q0R1_9PROT|nr:LacI family DNA-binding transcriptional regulator [Asaia krungthepensis]GBQ86314.1 LacI family transcription regulator [Asaia krungthepensis NRIC 0535]